MAIAKYLVDHAALETAISNTAAGAGTLAAYEDFTNAVWKFDTGKYPKGGAVPNPVQDAAFKVAVNKDQGFTLLGVFDASDPIYRRASSLSDFPKFSEGKSRHFVLPAGEYSCPLHCPLPASVIGKDAATVYKAAECHARSIACWDQRLYKGGRPGMPTVERGHHEFANPHATKIHFPYEAQAHPTYVAIAQDSLVQRLGAGSVGDWYVHERPSLVVGFNRDVELTGGGLEVGAYGQKFTAAATTNATSALTFVPTNNTAPFAGPFTVVEQVLQKAGAKLTYLNDANAVEVLDLMVPTTVMTHAMGIRAEVAVTTAVAALQWPAAAPDHKLTVTMEVTLAGGGNMIGVADTAITLTDTERNVFTSGLIDLTTAKTTVDLSCTFKIPAANNADVSYDFSLSKLVSSKPINHVDGTTTVPVLFNASGPKFTIKKHP